MFHRVQLKKKIYDLPPINDNSLTVWLQNIFIYELVSWKYNIKIFRPDRDSNPGPLG